VQKCILVTSPHRAFAELLRSSLEECGRYQVEVAYTAQEALAAAQTASFDLVVLDADVEDETLVQTGKRLMALQPDMLLMVIPPDNDPRHLSLNGIQPHSYLERPFYLPDLLTRLDRLFGIDSTAGPCLVWCPPSTRPDYRVGSETGSRSVMISRSCCGIQLTSCMPCWSKPGERWVSACS
jgi:DNA-binding response OmpR family regulator